MCALVKMQMYSNVQLLLSLEWGPLFPTYRQVSPKWKLVLLNWKLTADRKMSPVSWCVINYLCTGPKGCLHSGIISKAENSEHNSPQKETDVAVLILTTWLSAVNLLFWLGQCASCILPVCDTTTVVALAPSFYGHVRTIVTPCK